MTDASRPEPESRELEPFQVYSRVEIVGLLRALIERHTLVTVYFRGGEASVVTRLLAVNPDFEEVVFDCAQSACANDALARSSGIVAVAFLDHVKLQFRAPRAEPTVFADAPAFRVRLPESMLRLQRRNFFRVRVPATRPILLRLGEDADGRGRALRVVDLSCGGVGAIADRSVGPIAPGTVLTGCRMDLPDIGPIGCSVEVRHANMRPDHTLRLGLRFVDLPPAMATLLQRYINRVERAQLARGH